MSLNFSGCFQAASFVRRPDGLFDRQTLTIRQALPVRIGRYNWNPIFRIIGITLTWRATRPIGTTIPEIPCPFFRYSIVHDPFQKPRIEKATQS